jgi:AraC-like DNA-binding protein
MAIELTGHTWTPRPDLRPCLLAAMNAREPGGARRRVLHTYWAIDYAATAYGRYRVGSARRAWQPREKHTVHLYPPLTPYWEDLTAVGKGFTTICWYVDFRWGRGAELTRLIDPRFGYARFEDPAFRLGSLMQDAVRAAERTGDAAFWQVQALLCEVIGWLLSSRHNRNETYRLADSREDPDAKQPPSFTESVDRYLRQRLAEPLTLRQVGKDLHVSPSRLSHRYRDEAGRPPMAALRNMRITAAKGLLVRGHPLKVVAQRTGFCDLYHLSKSFKKLEGVSPRAFVRGR